VIFPFFRFLLGNLYPRYEILTKKIFFLPKPRSRRTPTLNLEWGRAWSEHIKRYVLGRRGEDKRSSPQERTKRVEGKENLCDII